MLGEQQPTFSFSITVNFTLDHFLSSLKFLLLNQGCVFSLLIRPPGVVPTNHSPTMHSCLLLARLDYSTYIASCIQLSACDIFFNLYTTYGLHSITINGIGQLWGVVKCYSFFLVKPTLKVGAFIVLDHAVHVNPSPRVSLNVEFDKTSQDIG